MGRWHTSNCQRLCSRPAGQPPRTALGARAVHALLLELHQQLLWQMVGAKLDSEAAQGISANNFTFSLSKKVQGGRNSIALCSS